MKKKFSNSPYYEAFVALRRLACLSQSRFWRIVLLFGWTARSAPSRFQIEDDYAKATRSCHSWQNTISNSVLYGKCRKYTLRCNKHARIYSQQASILKNLLQKI